MVRKKTGRPPFWETPEEMQAAIDGYFESCQGYALTDKDGNPVYDKYGYPVIMDKRPPTVTGLALALGFVSRQSLIDYQAKSRFADTVARAKARVEAYAEERLFDRDGANGAKFTLQYNFGWGAKEQEAERNQGGVIILGAVQNGE